MIKGALAPFFCWGKLADNHYFKGEDYYKLPTGIYDGKNLLSGLFDSFINSFNPLPATTRSGLLSEKYRNLFFF